MEAEVLGQEIKKFSAQYCRKSVQPISVRRNCNSTDLKKFLTLRILLTKLRLFLDALSEIMTSRGPQETFAWTGLLISAILFARYKSSYMMAH